MANGPDVHFIKKIDLQFSMDSPSGLILDIGGGGEGIIGRVYRSSVVSIDLSLQELKEAPDGPTKLVMDACHLGFPDHSFTNASLFFSLMFMVTDELEDIIREVYRVLVVGGLVEVWDAQISSRGNISSPYVGVELNVDCAGQIVSTGYGRKWPDFPLTAGYYTKLARTCGFEIRSISEEKAWFHQQWFKTDYRGKV
jgi:ubiquinone/menaquinone biosynthesis C-methylase UbiE